MTATLFVAIIPGVIDDQARDARLSGGATGLYRLLIEHADRHTGDLFPVTVAELADLSRFSRKAVRRYLEELEAAGLAVVDLRQGHDGRVRLPRHGEVIHKARSRQSTQRSRQSALGSRRSTHRSRQSTQGSRQSTRANRGNGDREREEDEKSSTSLPSVGARADASAGAAAPGGTDEVARQNALAVELNNLVREASEAMMEVDGVALPPRSRWWEDEDGGGPNKQALYIQLDDCGWWFHEGPIPAGMEVMVRRACAAAAHVWNRHVADRGAAGAEAARKALDAGRTPEERQRASVFEAERQAKEERERRRREAEMRRRGRAPDGSPL